MRFTIDLTPDGFVATKNEEVIASSTSSNDLLKFFNEIVSVISPTTKVIYDPTSL